MYRLDAAGLGGNSKLPLTWLVQAARNVGTSQLRDAVLTSISLGRTAQRGDIRGLYMFAIKDANSLISQFTDDGGVVVESLILICGRAPLRGDTAGGEKVLHAPRYAIQRASQFSFHGTAFGIPRLFHREIFSKCDERE